MQGTTGTRGYRYTRTARRWHEELQMGTSQAGGGRYDVTISFRRTSYGIIPALRIVRLRDGRLIYPFEGCADMPVCADTETAMQYARACGEKFVDGDIAVPE
jgi:hypothetical protein